MGSFLSGKCFVVSVSSPATEEGRTVIETAYVSAVASTFRRDAFASRLIELVRTIHLSPLAIGVGTVMMYRIESARVPERLPYLQSDCC
jgi:hypothetical protein